MSVDADRVVNLCVSLHELWSLPAQIAIALYLLYTQVRLPGNIKWHATVPMSSTVSSSGHLTKADMHDNQNRSSHARLIHRLHVIPSNDALSVTQASISCVPAFIQ